MHLRGCRARTTLVNHAQNAARSVHGGRSVWITDELLQDSFEKFCRIGTGCSTSQRRYSSHIPGPLEARRRLAKRRLNQLAASGGVEAPGFNLPTFALGDWLSNAERVWRQRRAPEVSSCVYEPPSQSLGSGLPPSSNPSKYSELNAWLDSILSPPKIEAKEDPQLDAPESIPQSLSQGEFKKFISEAKTLSDIKHVYNQLRSASLNSVACSCIAYAHLVKLQDVTNGDLLEFLHDPSLNVAMGSNVVSSFNPLSNRNWNVEERSQLLGLLDLGIAQGSVLPIHLVRFLEQATQSPNAPQNIDMTAGLIRHLAKHFDFVNSATKLATRLEAALGQAVRTVWQFYMGFADVGPQTTPVQNREAAKLQKQQYLTLHSLLSDLPEKYTKSALIGTLKIIVNDIWRHAAGSARKAGSLPILEKWLEQVRTFDYNILTDPVWIESHAYFANVGLSPTHIANHFEALEHNNKCLVLLRNWTRADLKHPLARRAKKAQNFDVDDMMRTLEIAFVLGKAKASKQHPTPAELAAPYLSILSSLKSQHLPVSRTLDWMLAINNGGDRATSLGGIMFGISKRQLNLASDKKHRTSIIKFINESGAIQAALAHQVFCAYPELTLSECPHLLSDCINGMVKPLPQDQVLSLLDRLDVQGVRDNSNDTELDESDMFPVRSRYSFQRIDIVHEAAVSYAHSPHLTTEEAFDGLLLCYKYLLAGGRGVVLDTRLSLAFVHVGVVRPLTRGGERVRSKLEPRQINVDRLRVVRDVVARIEGHKAAHLLELDIRNQLESMDLSS